ncbi:hypothetical protein CWATWH0402_1122 [Crocosphaera watsonii WH 0402]|uniref:Uncharacterized protein n=1 Tax=Crocosphaera watsonii WH 0402 TaxID=1284629 RepID=T2JPG2_CROWT|nr:hypothetical protein CWATWH0402_1122 [Crocosphaera watsonii WH 0402]
MQKGNNENKSNYSINSIPRNENQEIIINIGLNNIGLNIIKPLRIQ